MATSPPRMLTLTVQRKGPDDRHPVIAEYDDRSQALPRRMAGSFLLDMDHVDALDRAARNPSLGQVGREAAERAYGTYLGKRLFEGNPLSDGGTPEVKEKRVIRDLLALAQGDGGGCLHISLHIEALALKPMRWERLCVPTTSRGWDFASFNHPFSLYRPSGLLRAVSPLRRSDLRALIMVASPPPPRIQTWRC